MCLCVSKFSFLVTSTKTGANIFYAMIIEPNPVVLSLLKFQINGETTKICGKLSQFISDFEINTCKKYLQDTNFCLSSYMCVCEM